MKLGSADEIAEQMVGAILAEGDASGHALLLVNGFGGTPSLELYLMYNAARRILQGRGITIARAGRLLRQLAGDGRVLDHRDHAG